MLRRVVITATAALCALCYCSMFAAQTRHSTPKPSASKPSTREGKPSLSKEELEEQAKTIFAISLIDALADEAKNYDDHVMSVRVQARAADLLWAKDTERARAIFYRAWSIAEDAEREAWKIVEEKKKKFLSGESEGGFIPSPPNLRGEILQIVGRRDVKLTEELLAKLKTERADEKSEIPKNDIFDPTEPDLATARRLELALSLLQNGEIEKAISIADSSLQKVTSQAIIFLITLRQKRLALADARYSNLMARAAADPAADATSVSLLSSYVFTPTTLVTMTQNGTLSRKLDADSTSPEIQAKLKLAFLNVAAQILLRPLPTIGQDKTSAGRNGLYFTITRLLPLFEEYMPEKVYLLQNQLTSITENVSSEARERTNFFAKAGLTSDEPKDRELESILQEIDSSRDSRQLDNLYADAARVAAVKNDSRAGDLADKISNPALKDKVLAFVDFTSIRGLIAQKKADEALVQLKKAKLPLIQRVWFTTEIIKLFGKKREADARQLLEEAITEVRKVDNKESWKANALSALAVSYLTFDQPRAWQLAAEVVAAANNATSFADSSDLSVKLQIRGGISVIKSDAQSLNSTVLFAKLAHYNIYQASYLAKALSDDYQRALSLLAVASDQIKKKG